MSARLNRNSRRPTARSLAAGASAAVLSWAVASAAVALPTGEVIYDTSGGVGPGATFTPGAGTLDITQTHERVVIDWTSFNIASGETVTFIQGGDNFIAFNRVNPSSFTTIDGNLFGNGSVWVLSPGGMLFGPNANVNLGSFVAAIGEMSNFEADLVVAPSATQTFLGTGPALNTNTLTVSAGASIQVQDFVVLQGLNVTMDGDITSAGGAGFAMGEGLSIYFDSSNPSGVSLTTYYGVHSPTDRGQPLLTHTGTTTAAFIDITYAQSFEDGFSSVINLDGVMNASGAAPASMRGASNSSGISVLGLNSVTGLADGRTVLVNVLGDLNATGAGDIHLQGTDIFVTSGATMDSAAAVRMFTYGDITIQGDILANSQITIHSQAEDATIRIESTSSIESQTFGMDISGNRDNATVEVFGELRAAAAVFLRSKGDVYVGATADIWGNTDDGAGNFFGAILQAGLGYDFTLQQMNSVGAGDVYVAPGALIHTGNGNNPTRIFVGANYGGVEMAGTITGSRVSVGATEDIVISGNITGTDLVQVFSFNPQLPAAGGGDVIISGQLVADDATIVYAPFGDIVVESGALIVSDADGAPTTDVFGNTSEDFTYIGGNGFVTIEAGAQIFGGYGGTEDVIIRSNGADDEINEIASVEVFGEILAGGGEIYSETGSVRLHGGALVSSTGSFSISAGSFVVIEAGATVAGAGAADLGFPLVNIEEDAGIAILGADVAIAGDVYGQNIIIGVRDLDPDSVVYVGGVDDAVTFAGYDLGDDFRLSEAEIGNLHTGTLVIVAGADGIDVAADSVSDMIVEDLTLPSGITTLALGASSEAAIIFTGDLVPGNGETTLWVGFASEAGLELEDRTFIPGAIAILGSIGTAADPFDLVTLHSAGDIGMGSEEFLLAAEEDPEFDALTPNDLEVDHGHVFISTKGLQMAALGRIIQQNTGEQPGDFSGILFAAPEVQLELIYAPDELEGFSVGGDNAWTVNFTAGPTKVQLFGEVITETDPITGFDVAEQSNLLDPDIEANDAFTINSCRFGTSICTPIGGTSNEIPQFESPTEVEVETVAEESADEAPEEADEAAEEAEEGEEDTAESDESDDSAFIRSLIAPGADRAYEQDRLGEPITGSGNEDLWLGRREGVEP